jgi:prepilin-type N-terminal cleavage/methylation domain-containing protein
MKTQRHTPSGFSLIEVVIALGIASFCLITVFALLPIGINTNQNAFEQTAAAGIATAIAADLHGTPVVSTIAPTGAALTSSPPAGLSVTSRFQIQIPEVIPGSGTTPHIDINPAHQTIFFTEDGSPWTAQGVADPVGQTAKPSTPGPHYRATITFAPEEYTSPLSGIVAPRNKIFKVWILITWPAMADPNPANFPTNFSGSYEVTTALDCY